MSVTFISSPGGASQEHGRGVSHFLLRTLVCSLDGRPARSAAGSEEAGRTGTDDLMSQQQALRDCLNTK